MTACESMWVCVRLGSQSCNQSLAKPFLVCQVVACIYDFGSVWACMRERIFHSHIGLRCNESCTAGTVRIIMALRTAFFLVALSAGAASETLASSSSFMLISGVSAPAEMCLSVEGGVLEYHLALCCSLLTHAVSGSNDADGTPITLEPCAQAIAAGDGRELWQQGPGGQITNVLSKKCIGVKSAEEGGAVLLTDCDHGQSEWEVQGNGTHTHSNLCKAVHMCAESERSTEVGRSRPILLEPTRSHCRFQGRGCFVGDKCQQQC